MALYGQDTFVRPTTTGSTGISDAVGWGASSDGKAWATRKGTGYSYNIAVNQGRVTGNNVDALLTLGPNTYAANEVLTSFTTTSGVTTNWLGACLRLDQTGATGYVGYVHCGASSAGTLAIAVYNG